LSKHRGEIAERFGALNPWYSNVDVRVLQDLGLAQAADGSHTLQLSLDLLNVGNLLDLELGSPGKSRAPRRQSHSRSDVHGFNTARRAGVSTSPAPRKTFIDDPDLLSRWRAQVGLRYFFN
jgi:hypothetical protein